RRDQHVPLPPNQWLSRHQGSERTANASPTLVSSTDRSPTARRQSSPHVPTRDPIRQYRRTTTRPSQDCPLYRTAPDLTRHPMHMPTRTVRGHFRTPGRMDVLARHPNIFHLGELPVVTERPVAGFDRGADRDRRLTFRAGET